MLARALAINRIGFGLTYILFPNRAGSWIGKTARDPRTQILIRALGARDLALATGSLVAMSREGSRSVQLWMAAQALADGTDLAATLAARQTLPLRNVLFAAGVAGASTAIALAAALRPG
jgi:hypothetical protein